MSDIFDDLVGREQTISFEHDLCFLSEEITYFTAMLYLYRPFVENPLSSPIKIDGKTFYIADQTLEGKRYDYFVDILFEKIHSFYDRLANQIAVLFPDKLKKKDNIHFHKVIEKLQVDYADNNDFSWLLNFRDNEYKVMNDQRRNSVHKISIVTKNFNEQALKNSMDYEKTKGLTDKRMDYPDYFKKMHYLCLLGFEKTLGFLEVVKKKIINKK
jgi:hypothetical protein